MATAASSAAADAAYGRKPFQLVPGARFFLGMHTHYLWPQGDFLVPAGGRPGSGTRVGVTDELGLNPTAGTSLSLEGTILENHLLNLNYLTFSPTGLSTVGRTFRMQNRTYPAGTVLETHLDFHWFRFGYGYALRNAPPVLVAPKIGVHHVRHRIMLNGETEETGLLSNTRRLDATYPVLGFFSGVQLPYGVEIWAEAEGMHLITRGFLTHVNIEARWEVVPDMSISMGGGNRTVHYLETNQTLNNEWHYRIFDFHAGVAFSF